MARKKKSDSPADYIQPLNINGLQGRMLHMPGPKKDSREVLFIYGHHSSLERWWGVVKFINRYAAVTMPDLPGFGGMDSFYKLGKNGSIDNLADYLAAFMKLRYKRRKVVIVGMSLGFVIATRMLQRYPELTKRIDMLVSFAGFAHHSDFTFSRFRRRAYMTMTYLFEHRIPALFFRHVVLRPGFISRAYRWSGNKKFIDVGPEQLDELIRFEIKLWHQNDVRTWMRTTREFLSLDNCRARVDLPVSHIGIKGDHYFDNDVVEQHMRVIYEDFELVELLDLQQHAPSVIADEKAASVFIPQKLRRKLRKS